MAGSLDALFEFLFRHPRVAYRQGELIFSASWPPLLLAAVLTLALAGVVWSYRSGLGGGRRGWLLAGVRAAVLGLLLVCLLRPTLVLSTVVPRENVVAVLVDDSRSMEIRDVGGRSRGEVARELAVEGESPLLHELRERFLVRHFRFSAGAERLNEPGALTFQGSRTRIGPALEHVRREFASVPLAGVVLVTDGGDQDPRALEDALLAYRSQGIPVHVVGVGAEELDPDVSLDRVELPGSVLQGSTVLAEAVVSHQGLGGVVVPVEVEEEDGRLLASREVELPRGGGSVSVQVPFTVEEAGVRSLRVRVPPQDGEVVPENNHRDVSLRVRGEPEKILYFEGEPRFEVAFLRRALEDDEAVRLVVLQRTAEDRYLRLGLENPDELLNGFPTSREELSRYRALILGSVEASYFSSDQLRMIHDFVDRRGGSLLVLGGRRSMAEGGYGGTPLAPVFPLDPAGDGGRDDPFLAHVQVRPTPRGEAHPALHFDVNDEAGGVLAGWDRLPSLTTVNRMGSPRAGATVLLEGEGPEVPGGRQPVLAFQPYGAGLSAALAVQDTWLWQMHADVPLEDESHQRFWRQLLRWMVQEVPDPVYAEAVRTRVAPGEEVELVARVKDEAYLPVNDAWVTARVVDPVGGEEEMVLAWGVDRDGQYQGSYLPERQGPYEFHLEVRLDSQNQEAPLLRPPPIQVEVGVLDDELRSGAMRGELLRRIARETGGEFHEPNSVSGLTQALEHTDRGTVAEEERDLWDLPVVFLLVVGLLSTEWLVRRRKGWA